jgi:hypothetical protein
MNLVARVSRWLCAQHAPGSERDRPPSSKGGTSCRQSHYSVAKVPDTLEGALGGGAIAHSFHRPEMIGPFAKALSPKRQRTVHRIREILNEGSIPAG